MMIEDIYIDALLASAAYVDWNETDKVILEEKLIKQGFTEEQAFEYFLKDQARFTVLTKDYQGDPDSGFYAVIFEDTKDKEKYLAFRGSDDAADAFSNILLTVGYTPYYLANLIPGKSIIDEVASLILKDPNQLKSTSDFLNKAGVVDGLGNVSPNWEESLNVVGHSLGGHLAQMFEVLRPELTKSVTSINGAGIAATDALVLSVAEMLAGISVDDSNVVNLYAETGLEVITNDVWFQQLGARLPVWIENKGIDNHSIESFIQALDLYRVVAALNPNLDSESGLKGDLFDYFETLSVGDRVGTLDHLKQSITQMLGFSEEGLHPDAIYNAIVDGDISVDWIDLRGMSSAEVLDMSQQESGLGAAYRFAMVNLLPFTFGEGLNLLNIEDFDVGNFSENWLIDRAEFLTRHIQVSRLDDKSKSYGDYYQDLALREEVGNPVGIHFADKSRNIFGSEESETIKGMGGGGAVDHLYGMAGDDILKGNGADDYIEGGVGDDTYIWRSGENQFGEYYNHGNDIIVEVNDGNSNTIIINHKDKGKYNLGAALESGTLILQELPAFEQWELIDNNDDRFAHVYFSNENDLIVAIDNGNDVADSFLTIKDFRQGGILNNWFGIDLENSEKSVNHEVEGYIYHVEDDWLHLGNGEVVPGEWFNQYHLNVNWVRKDLDKRVEYNADEFYNNSTKSARSSDYIRSYWFDGDQQSDFLVGSDWSDEQEIADSSGVYDYELSWVEVGEHRIGDLINGNDGDDLIQGEQISDIVNDIGDADLLIGGRGSDRLYGGYGNDVLFGAQVAIGSFLTNYNYIENYSNEDADDGLVAWQDVEHKDDHDFLMGGKGNDHLITGGGYDQLHGEEGEDRIFAGAGGDFIDGGAGDDIIFADSTYSLSAETISPNFINPDNPKTMFDVSRFDVEKDFDDKIIAGSGNDIVYGEIGNDQIFGGDGDDELRGDRSNAEIPSLLNEKYKKLPGNYHGNDFISGGSGDDSIDGNGGDDIILGGQGDDVIRGDDDLLSGEFHGNDSIDGGAGDDLIEGNGGNDIISGGDGDDVIWGDWQADKIVYSGTQFVIEPLGNSYHGKDKIDGGSGNDVIFTGKGNDIVYESEGSDLIIIDSGRKTIEVGEKTQIRKVSSDAKAVIKFESLNSDELFWAKKDGNLLISDGENMSSASKVLVVEIAELSGMTLMLADQKIGLNKLYKQLKANGEPTADVTEPFSYHQRVSTAITLGSEVVEANGDENNNQIVANSLDNHLLGLSGNDIINGLNGDDQINGGLGNDTLYGSNDNDTLNGDRGMDVLFGGDGLDTLQGGRGSDSLYGGAHNDLLVGGAGNDNYFWSAGDGSDTIDNSGGGKDTLNMQAIEHTKLWFQGEGDDLLIHDTIAGHRIRIKNWYGEDDSVKLDAIKTDGASLDLSKLELLVNAMAVFDADEADDGIVTQQSQDQLDVALVEAWG